VFFSRLTSTCRPNQMKPASDSISSYAWAGWVLHAVPDIVDRRLGAPVIGDLRPARERDIRALFVLFGYMPLSLVRPTDRRMLLRSLLAPPRCSR